MGTIAQQYLRKMQGFDTRPEIEKEVDAAVAQISITATPSDKTSPKSGNVAEAKDKASDQMLRAKSKAKADLSSAIKKIEDVNAKMQRAKKKETDDKKYASFEKRLSANHEKIQKMKDEWHKKWDKVKR